MDLGTWGCPACTSRLEPRERDLRCSRGHVFATRESLPVLIATEETHLLDDGVAYAAAWKADSLAPPRGMALDLPFVRSPYWKPKARSLEALLNLLGPANGRKAADIGAGTGWLAYRLTEAGFVSYATDLLWDADVGLGAARAYDATKHRFERAIASLSRWPFQSGTMDVAICNASLHYLSDIRPAISEAARVLNSEGVFVVMNDPVHADRESAARASHDFKERMRAGGGAGRLVDHHRHFVASDLEREIRSEFPRLSRHDPNFGAWFRISRAVKSILLRMELASFPIYVAHR